MVTDNLARSLAQSSSPQHPSAVSTCSRPAAYNQKTSPIALRRPPAALTRGP